MIDNSSQEELRLKIKKRIRELGLNQRDFAQMLGAHPVTLSHWLTGKEKISKAYLLLLKLIFNLKESKS